MSNQSSVEWLAVELKEKMQMWNSTKNYQEFHIVLEAGEFAKLIEQAKAMHKEEVKNSYISGYLDNGYYEGAEKDASKLWDETYGFAHNETFGE